MTLKQLEDQGFTLRRDHWGQVPVRSALSVWWFVAAAVLGAAGAVIMVLGRGGVATWLGALACIASFIAFAALGAIAVDRRVARIERLVRRGDGDERRDGDRSG